MSKESQILKNISKRNEAFKPNPKLDQLILDLKAQLEPVQLEENKRYISPENPALIIVGCPRSGTTILTQFLAASKKFSYPTNFLSRFAYAPSVGAKIQEMLFNEDYDFRGELSDLVSAPDFNSNLGRTNGALHINQFFHFWRKFFPVHDPGYLDPEELNQIDIDRMRSEIGSIENVFQKPFMSKSMMLQYNIKFFADNVPEFVFLQVKRDPIYVMQSILISRRKYYNSDEIWWSVKPKEYPFLADMDPYHQIAGQVLFTERAMEKELAEVPRERKIIFSYEDFCKEPIELYNQIRELYKNKGSDIGEAHVSDSFSSGNTVKINNEELERLEEAYKYLEGLSEKEINTNL